LYELRNIIQYESPDDVLTQIRHRRIYSIV